MVSLSKSISWTLLCQYDLKKDAFENVPFSSQSKQ